MRWADRPASNAETIPSRNDSHPLRRPSDPAVELAGFADRPPSSEPADPVVKWAGFGAAVASTAPPSRLNRTYRATVSRCSPSSRAIRRCDHPRSANLTLIPFPALVIGEPSSPVVRGEARL